MADRPFTIGNEENDALVLARKWAEAARRDPSPSGEFLAMDLDYIASEIDELRRLRDGLVNVLRLVNPYANA